MKRLALLQRIDARYLLCVFAALLLAAMWTTTLVQSRAARRTQIDNAQRDARSLARLIEEHAGRTIDSADQVAIYLRYRYNAVGGALDIASDVEQGLGPAPIYHLFSIVDARGKLVLSSQPFEAMNLADREHVKVHMARDDGALFISHALLGRVSKKWSIQLTRRINHPDGAFKGVVVVSMDPQYFIRLYQDIDIGPHGAIALVGTDGLVRVGRDGARDASGQDVGATPLFAAMRANGRGLMEGAFDARARISAYEKLEGYPLYVVVGIDLEDRLQGYDSARSVALLLAGAKSAIILLFTASLIVLFGRLLKSRARAIAANQAKSRFLSNMSHELRTPLNGILGYSELLVEELGTSRHGRFARSVHTCGVRLLAQIDAVLELNTLQSHGAELALRVEPLGEMMQHALAGHLGAAETNGIALRCDIDAAVPAQCACDRAKLLRVLAALLSNAVRLSAAGQVLLQVALAGGGLRFQVSDSGPGVPAELQHRMFDPFSQAEDAPSRASDGAGLGLAIAAHLVHLMGARLTVQSAPGAGATFSFILPGAQAAPAGIPEAP